MKMVPYNLRYNDVFKINKSSETFCRSFSEMNLMRAFAPIKEERAI